MLVILQFYIHSTEASRNRRGGGGEETVTMQTLEESLFSRDEGGFVFFAYLSATTVLS